MSQQTHYHHVIIGSDTAGLNAALLAAEHGSVLVIAKGRTDDHHSRYYDDGDATGRSTDNTLAEQVRSNPGVTVLEGAHAIRICVEDGVAAGVEIMNADTGEAHAVSSGAVIVATGGAGQLYRYTTNPPDATGDGVALAFLAGADVIDMEFYRFHPTALRLEGASALPLPEAMRSQGAILRNADGQPFMTAYHPMAGLAPGDAVSRAIASEMARADGQPVLLDISHLPESTVTDYFPSIRAACLRYGLDVIRHPIPVAPAAHYLMGGIRIDPWGRTSVPGLYACGEVACAATPGTDPLADNALPDPWESSRRLVDATLGNAPAYAPVDDAGNLRIPLADRAMVCATVPERGRENLQDMMWRNAGITRNGTRLLLTARILNLWQRTMPPPQTVNDHELRNMLITARLIVEAALQRRESRGHHHREDFPEPSDEWQRHVVIGST